MPSPPGRRVALLLGVALLAAIALPVGARAVASRYHDDSLWANSLRSLGGLEMPFDFGVYLGAADAVRHDESPYVDPDALTADSPAPYVYPPVLALGLVPFTALPADVGGSSPAGVLFSLIVVASTLAALGALGVRDWRCYPIALLYPVTLENIEYGAIGPVLTLLVALGWRYRDRVARVAAAIGAAVALKVFLWPAVVWLAATRRWSAAIAASAAGLGLALVSWVVIGFRGLVDYPALLRKLSDLEAESSYSAFAILRAVEVPAAVARTVVAAAALSLLLLAWRAARSAGDRADRDRRSLTLALAAGFVLTPILWLHYLVLLVVPISLARPRLSALWFAPLALTVFEALDWYRGWPHGDGKALASVGLLVALVFVVSARPRPRVDTPRGAAARA